MRYVEFREAAGHEGGAAKYFEDDIISLAKMSTAERNAGKEIETIYKENADEFLAPSKKDSTIAAVTALNKKFPDEDWEFGENSNYALKNAPAPNYGVKSAKSDIILNDKAISVKLDTDFVVSSAQNKEEFEGVFTSALNYYIQQNQVDFDTNALVESLKKQIETAKNDYVGEVKRRLLPASRKLKILDKLSDVNEVYEDLKNYIEEQQKDAIDEYANAAKVLKSGILKEIQSTLKNNEELKNYVIWEGLSASLKWNFNFPYAEWVLSPSGVYSVKSPDDPYIAAVSSVSKFDIRALPAGRIRSGTSAFSKYYKSQIEKGNAVDISKMYDELTQMAFGMKIDVQKKQLDKIDINEALSIKDMINKVVEWVNGLVQKIASMFNALLQKLEKFKSGGLLDWMNALGVEVEGEIRLP